MSDELFKDKIWRIDVKFNEISAIAWFGVMKCDERFEKGNVHDRSRLCVYQSNGFCGQSGFCYGNHPWKSDDTISLEINLTSPSVSSSASPSEGPAETTPPSFVISAPSPSYGWSPPPSLSSSAEETGHTLHFYNNYELQPVSYVNIPTPLRFVLYCNYADSSCAILDVKEIKPEESAVYKLSQKEVEAREIFDPDGKEYKGRAVKWNSTHKREDR